MFLEYLFQGTDSSKYTYDLCTVRTLIFLWARDAASAFEVLNSFMAYLLAVHDLFNGGCYYEGGC